MENKKGAFVVKNKMKLQILKGKGRIEGSEKQLYYCVKEFLSDRYSGCSVKGETQQSGFGTLDVYVVDEKDKKIGVEVKPYFTLLGAEGTKAFGQALLCKARNDIKKMFVAFPMSDQIDDTKELIFGNSRKNFEKIWEKLGLKEKGEIGNLSLRDINRHIYDKAYSSLEIGLLGIIGHVEYGEFQVDSVEVLKNFD